MSELPHTASPAAPVQSAPPQRLLSLDAYRGLIMLMMASAGLELTYVVKNSPDAAASPFWQMVAYHCNHAEWVGCALWDLIQPAFMFMVGVALAFSAAKRQAGGQAFGGMFLHAVWRGLILVLLAVFLTSYGKGRTVWLFTNVLAQIGLGYPFLFLLGWSRPRTQWIAAGAILVGTWAAFALWPLPPAGFDWKSAGIPEAWPHLTGFAAHWDKNANVFSAFDQWFLNLFPREKPFVFEPGGYQTLNFIPSLATMIFGLLAGQLLLGSAPLARKLRLLILAGFAGLASGWLLDWGGVCPMVKRIWTPSFALFSGGWVTLFLAGFVAIIEWRGWRRWAFPLLVAGLNPITLYVLWQSMGAFIKDNVRRHFGGDPFGALSRFFSDAVDAAGRPLYERTFERLTVLLVLWLILLWMYRRKIVVRI